MIHGLKLWNDDNTYYTQTNNPTDKILKVLETCGPTSATSLVHATGHNVEILCPGLYRPQPEEVLTDYLNDPRNFQKLQQARIDILPSHYMGNQIAQYYPIAVKEVFGINCEYFEGLSFKKIKESLKKNIGVMVCMKDPGHFVGIVAYDDIKEEIIYNDPWPNNPWPGYLQGSSGFNRHMLWNLIKPNLKPYLILIGD